MNTIELINDRRTRADFARLRSVLACASNDAARHVINKVLVEKDEDGITVCGTDGRRLRRDRFNLEAEPGLYDIKTSSAKAVFLVKSGEELVFPNYRQAIPRDGRDDAYALEGTGGLFVLRAAAALGCWLDPDLVELGDGETVTLHLQKGDPSLGAVLARNADTVFVLMPVRLDQPWVREVEAIQAERAMEALKQRNPEALAA